MAGASLSVKLLKRITRHVIVTADGAAYYQRCLGILADVRDTEESLANTRANPGAHLWMDMPSGLGLQVIIPALRQPVMQGETAGATW